jgi:hypothetical protein
MTSRVLALTRYPGVAGYAGHRGGGNVGEAYGAWFLGAR